VATCEELATKSSKALSDEVAEVPADDEETDTMTLDVVETGVISVLTGGISPVATALLAALPSEWRPETRLYPPTPKRAPTTTAATTMRASLWFCGFIY
jgi:hypothetical protein